MYNIYYFNSFAREIEERYFELKDILFALSKIVILMLVTLLHKSVRNMYAIAFGKSARINMQADYIRERKRVP